MPINRLADAEAAMSGIAGTIDDGEVVYRIHYWGFQSAHYDNPVHRHSFYEICYVLDGAGEYEDEGRTFPLGPGTHFASLPGRWHQIRSASGLALLYVAFELSGANERRAAGERYAQRLESGADLAPVRVGPELPAALLWQALRAFAEQGGTRRLAAAAALLLSALPDVFAPQIADRDRDRPAVRSRSQLAERAKRFIRDNLSRPLKLGDVAAYLHVSERHFSRLFARDTGHAFGNYLKLERMRHAEARLKTTDASVADIAEETGYQSVHYFTRVFADHFGQPPAAYRRSFLTAAPRPETAPPSEEARQVAEEA